MQSYFLQRAELLDQKFKLLAQYPALPGIIQQQFGVPIPLPRQGAKSYTEIWRVKTVRRCTNLDDLVDPNFYRLASYGLPFKCGWVAENGESTIGYEQVTRVFQDMSLIEDWFELCLKNEPPRTTLHKCIQLYNTVELSSKESNFISKPTHEYVIKRNCNETAKNCDSDHVNRTTCDTTNLQRLDYGDCVDFNKLLVCCSAIKPTLRKSSLPDEKTAQTQTLQSSACDSFPSTLKKVFGKKWLKTSELNTAVRLGR